MDFLKEIAIRCLESVTKESLNKGDMIYALFSELRKGIIEEGYVFKIFAGVMEFSDTKVVKVSFIVGRNSKEEVVVLTGLGEEETVEEAYEKALYNLFWQILGQREHFSFQDSLQDSNEVDLNKLEKDSKDEDTVTENTTKTSKNISYKQSSYNPREKGKDGSSGEDKGKDFSITPAQKRFLLSLCKILELNEEELKDVIKRELNKEDLNSLSKKEASVLIDSLNQIARRTHQNKEQTE